MARDSDDPPTHASAGQFSGLYPSEKTIPAVYESQRKQASQMIAIIEAFGTQRRDLRLIRKDWDALRLDLEDQIAQIASSGKTSWGERAEHIEQDVADLGKKLDKLLELVTAANLKAVQFETEMRTRLAVGWGAVVMGAGVLSFLVGLAMKFWK